MMIVAFCCSIEADSDLVLCSSIPLSYQLPSPNQPNKSHRASIIIGLHLCIVTEPFCSKGTAIRVSKLIRVGSQFCASSADTSAAATALLHVCLDHTPTQIMIIRDYSQIARSYWCSPVSLLWLLASNLLASPSGHLHGRELPKLLGGISATWTSSHAYAAARLLHCGRTYLILLHEYIMSL